MLIGVDAGGSHTELGVSVAPGRTPRVRVRGPGVDLGQRVGEAATTIRALLREAEAALIEQDRAVSGAQAPLQVRAWVVGAAGAGRSDARDALADALRDPHLPPPRIVTDIELALASAFPDTCGVLVGAGTGSYAAACTPGEGVLRVGGWGPVLSDEGSGFDLASRSLREVARELDGRAAPTELSATLLRATGCADLDALVTWSTRATRPGLAALAHPVCDLAQAGAPAALAQVDHAAEALLALAHAVAARLSARPVPVALAGGLLTPSSPVRVALVRRLAASDWAHPIEPVIDPVLGALWLAGRGG